MTITSPGTFLRIMILISARTCHSTGNLRMTVTGGVPGVRHVVLKVLKDKAT
jgi:hypothetical protein